jgi:parallel beta-helix repeat protein
MLFSYARNCSVQNVLSVMTNFAHISVDYSLNISMEHVDFYNSFSHGNGGNGYGVTLQFSSSDCLVQNCVFRKLRHGIVIQSGANGNMIRGNYALEGYWEDVKLPKYSSGDIVLHGNYPFSNTIEGNVCNQIVVDKSHGLNGYNVILKNRLLKYGVFIQKGSTQSVLVKQNDLVRSKCLEGKIRGGKNEMITLDNRRNGKVFKNKSLESLNCMPFKDKLLQVYSIGYPCDFHNFHNAAYFRYNSSRVSMLN